MPKKKKKLAATKAARDGALVQSKECKDKEVKQNFSSLADLRSLYRELKAEAVLVRQAPTFAQREPERQRLPNPAAPQSTKSEAHAFDSWQQTKPSSSASSWQMAARLALTQQPKTVMQSQRLSDAYEPILAHYKDGSAYFCKPGVGPDIARKLWQRKVAIQAQIDLHGMRLDEARSTLTEFVQDVVEEGLRCIRVIHGKGLGTLKSKVYTWLTQLREVLAFCEARPHEGGSGAVIVLLRSARRAYMD